MSSSGDDKEEEEEEEEKSDYDGGSTKFGPGLQHLLKLKRGGKKRKYPFHVGDESECAYVMRNDFDDEEYVLQGWDTTHTEYSRSLDHPDGIAPATAASAPATAAPAPLEG